MNNILSVDVEDWFHILELDGAPDIQRWSTLESRVERNFHLLLDTFDETETKATCFFLGWIAERFPNLIAEAHHRGHEVASHGYAHQLIYTQTQSQFSEDIRRAKNILENITGKSVEGYRAPGFSITEQTPWALDEISAAGYHYDSSIFPAPRGHGGLVGTPLQPYHVKIGDKTLIEFPISVAPILKRMVCFFGGGYLRLFPYPLIARMTKSVNKQGRPVIYYLHPREVDPSHPRLPMGFVRRFKSYINLHSTLPKLKRLQKDQRLVPFSTWLQQHECELE